MRCRQFLRVIAQKVGAHIGFSGIIMGHGGVQLRRKHFTLHRAVRLGGLLQLQGQDRTHQLIRVALGAEEIAQREGDKASPPVRCGQPLGILQHMRMGAHDDICAPVCQILRQCALAVHNGMAVLYAPVHSHHHKICLLTRQAHLPLDHIGLAGVDDIGGHGTALGGVIVDSGKFDWVASGKFPQLTEPDPSYHGVRFVDAAGAAAYAVRIRAVLLRDTGAAISPFNAFILLQGLETLSLRVERHVENALKVVDFLERHPKVIAVNHPSLPNHPDHALYRKYFPKGAGSIFTFEVKGGVKEAQAFIDNLQIFSLLANVADVKSLVIHPATTTHSQLSEQELAEQGIKPGTVRLSIGTEHIDDLLDDVSQALEKI